MTLDEAINYFGSGYRLCKEIGIKIQNVTEWKKLGYIPPLSQFKIEAVTRGRLKSDWTRNSND